MDIDVMEIISLYGGVVGYNYGDVINCINYGKVLGDIGGGMEKCVAGIAAYNNNGNIESCVNRGNITLKGEKTYGGCVGGISGERNGGNSYIANCTNYGIISSTDETFTYTAGISANAYGDMIGCKNYGTIKSESYAAVLSIFTGLVYPATAGIAAEAYGTVSDCINYSREIYCADGNINGIVATGSATVTNCQSEF